VDQSAAQSLAHHSRNPGVPITECVYGDSTGEIQIPFAIGIDEINSFTSHELHWSALVGAEERGVYRSSSLDDFFFNGQRDGGHMTTLWD